MSFSNRVDVRSSRWGTLRIILYTIIARTSTIKEAAAACTARENKKGSRCGRLVNYAWVTVSSAEQNHYTIRR